MHRLSTLPSILFALFLLAGCDAFEDDPDLTGTWTGTLRYGSAVMDLRLSLHAEEEEGSDDQGIIGSGSLTGERSIGLAVYGGYTDPGVTLFMNFRQGGHPDEPELHFTGEMKGDDEIRGTVAGFDGEVTLKRQ